MDKTVLHYNETVKSVLAERSQDAIKTLIQAAELTRKSKIKSTNYIDSYFKKAKDHLL